MSEENSSGVTVTDAVTGETAFRGAAAAGELALNDAATGRRAYVIKNLSASQLAVADAGNHFSSDTVEGALQEIGAALDMRIIQSSDSIVPQEHQVFRHDIASGETISISSTGLSSGECMTFELWLDMPSTVVSFTLPILTWVDGAAPDFTEGSTRYAITVRWNGTKFLANLAYKEALA